MHLRHLVQAFFLVGFAAAAGLQLGFFPISRDPTERALGYGVQVLTPDRPSINTAEISRPDEDFSHIIAGDSGSDFTGRVTRVVDGDTFWISGQDVRVRVWGLDAPETNRPGGSAATAQLSLLISDKPLRCRQRHIDPYGRIVGQCWLPDGRDITAAMIASGKAREYCRFSGNYYGTC